MNYKKEEELILDKFKLHYESFPEGKILPIEKPDFIIQGKNRKIGIELTEVFLDSNDNNMMSRLERKYSDRRIFTSVLINKLQCLVNFKFCISVFFNDYKPIRKLKRENISNIIVDLVKDSFKILDDKQELIYDDLFNLPEEIYAVEILRYDGLSESFDRIDAGEIFFDLTETHINTILLKKEESLINYQNCDEQWLLIHEGKGLSGTFKNINISKPIESTFDKVVLFRINSCEIIELK
ncbi:conserved protein of unknown function [Tenacibaculum sp. 190130A14a]|uniref:Uncharacterized protein n=1 Tax=Tenacibaculum polynesiense TaxID=3137857 RepID=A0ABP1ESL9_9FLAO